MQGYLGFLRGPGGKKQGLEQGCSLWHLWDEGRVKMQREVEEGGPEERAWPCPGWLDGVGTKCNMHIHWQTSIGDPLSINPTGRTTAWSECVLRLTLSSQEAKTQAKGQEETTLSDAQQPALCVCKRITTSWDGCNCCTWSYSSRSCLFPFATQLQECAIGITTALRSHKSSWQAWLNVLACHPYINGRTTFYPVWSPTVSFIIF